MYRVNHREWDFKYHVKVLKYNEPKGKSSLFMAFHW